MTAAQAFILFAWFALPLLAAAFLWLFGWPGKYRDTPMAWHLFATTAIAGLEPVGFLLSGLTLWPAVAIYTGSLSVMAWRIVLLVRQRRRTTTKE